MKGREKVNIYAPGQANGIDILAINTSNYRKI